MSKYEKCKQKEINNILKKFERGELYDIQHKPIENMKQALAISLSIAEKICAGKRTSKDSQKIKDRALKSLYNNKEIKEGRLAYTTVKTIVAMIHEYKKDKNYAVSNKLKNDLLLRVLKSIQAGNQNKLIIKEVIGLLSK